MIHLVQCSQQGIVCKARIRIKAMAGAKAKERFLGNEDSRKGFWEMKIGECASKNFTLLFLLLCIFDSGMLPLFCYCA